MREVVFLGPLACLIHVTLLDTDGTAYGGEMSQRVKWCGLLEHLEGELLDEWLAGLEFLDIDLDGSGFAL